MPLTRSNRLPVGASSDNRSFSTGNLQNTCFQYAAKQQRARIPAEFQHQAITNNTAGGSQRLDGLLDTFLASNCYERRSNSVKDLKNMFDVNDGPSKNKDARRGENIIPGATTLFRPSLSTFKLRKGLGDPAEEEQEVGSTMNATFNRGVNKNLPPEVAILQKRLAEFQEKLRHQEGRHIQERLTWKGQTMELQRLRRERDQLMEDQANQRYQLRGTQNIAEAVVAENKQLRADCHALQPEVSNQQDGVVDWEKKLNELNRESIKKDKKIGTLAAQLEETNEQLQKETDNNTDFVIQLQQSEQDLRRQSSNKDRKITILKAELDEMTEQLQKETDWNTEIVSELRASENKLRLESSRKDLAIGHLMEELNESRHTLQVQRSQPDLGLNSCQHNCIELELNRSSGSLRTEDLASGCGNCPRGASTATSTKNMKASSRVTDLKVIEKLEETQNQLKEELATAKLKTLKTMRAVRTKLVEERTKIKRDRQEIQDLKRTVVKESVQAVAVISGLRGLVESMQEKITTLQQENKALKSVMQ